MTSPDPSLPPFLMTSDPGSFARQTILERKPQIIRQVLENNVYPREIASALEDFRQEIASRPLRPLSESAPDVQDWNQQVEPFLGRSWLEIPWYFAESFFYRRLLEAVGYFQDGPERGRDPFRIQKQAQIGRDLQRLSPTWGQFSTLEPGQRFEALLHSSLWGNRADLSNFTVKVEAASALATVAERPMILIDHTQQVASLLAGGMKRVDVLCDNIGSDLLFDLALADFLLGSAWVQKIYFHLKNQPFFVSDAMPADVRTTLSLLQVASGLELQALGQRLEAQLAQGRLVFLTDPFWTTCLMFRQMPLHLRQDLAEAGLVLVKGDVNYRRLLDDRRWPPTTRMEEVCTYFPAPFVALRTLKGEIVVSLGPGQAQALQMEDPTWLIDGKRGIIQLVGHPAKE
jgi:uncharacterized protein with ATP-grasp and redox domains